MWHAIIASAPCHCRTRAQHIIVTFAERRLCPSMSPSPNTNERAGIFLGPSPDVGAMADSFSLGCPRQIITQQQGWSIWQTGPAGEEMWLLTSKMCLVINRGRQAWLHDPICKNYDITIFSINMGISIINNYLRIGYYSCVSNYGDNWLWVG